MCNGNVNYFPTFRTWLGMPLETLSKYVARIMRENGLSARDVERRSGNGITDAYVTHVVKGTAANLSIVKAQALAVGLGVDEDELFSVARGVAMKRKAAMTNEPVSVPEITRAVQLLLALSPQKLRRLLKIIEREAK